MVYPTSLRAPHHKSSGKKMDLDPDSSSTTACVWWRNPQPSADSKQGESAHRRERGGREMRNLSQIGCEGKGTLPLHGAMVHGGRLPLPLMGLFRPICL